MTPIDRKLDAIREGLNVLARRMDEQERSRERRRDEEQERRRIEHVRDVLDHGRTI